MSRKITFKSLRRGTVYVLTIADGNSTVVNLTPSATPFETDVDSSDEFFSPVRTQSGNIEIVGEISDVEPLLSSDPASRLVTLHGTEGSTTTLRWKGYLQTTTFSQTWDKGPLPISIPVVSHLGIIESYTFQRVDYVRFAEFFKSLSEVTGTAFYTSFVFPNITDIATILKYNFSGQAFAKWDDKTNTYEYGNYNEVLEEICKLFGWVAIEVADQLCLVAPDSTDGYVQFTAAQIATLASNGTATGTTVSQSTIVEAIDGADHTIDYLPGMKSVKVTGTPGNGFGQLFSFNVDNLEIRSTEEYSRAKSSSSTEYYHYFTKNYGDSDEIDVTYQGNIRYDNFWYDDDTLRSGSCCVTDRQLETDSSETPSPVTKDSNWQNHIICLPATSAGQKNIFSINTAREHIASGLMSDKYIAIKFTMRKSNTYHDDWEAVKKAKIGMTVTIGDVNYASGRLNNYGDVVEDSTCIYSTVYVPVQSGDSVRWVYSANSANANARMVMYDSSKTLVSFSNASNASGTKTVTISSGVSFIRASFFSNYKDNARLYVNNVEVYRPVGDYLMDGDIILKDGSPYYAQAGYANADGCVALLAPTNQSGALHIQFNLLEEVLGWPYVDFENISVSYANVWRRHLNDPLDENTTMFEIGNGFTEEMEQTNKLTTQRPEFPNQITSEQTGWGLVLSDSLQPIMKLYGNKYPEEALAERMRDHFSISRKMITAQLLSRGGMFSPLHLHVPGSGSGMACLAQKVNWRDDQITAYLFEL